MPRVQTNPQYDFFARYEHAWDARDLSSSNKLPVLDLPATLDFDRPAQEHRDSGVHLPPPSPYTLAEQHQEHRRSRFLEHLNDVFGLETLREEADDYNTMATFAYYASTNNSSRTLFADEEREEYPAMSWLEAECRGLTEDPRSSFTWMTTTRPEATRGFSSSSTWTLVGSTAAQPTPRSRRAQRGEVDPADEQYLGPLALMSVDSFDVTRRRSPKSRSKKAKLWHGFKKLWCIGP